jgi:serine/threonine protein phosphatase PrpC
VRESRLFATSSITAASGAVGHDHVGVIHRTDSVVLVVADGAGGLTGAAKASASIVARVAELAETATEVIDPLRWVSLLHELDLALAGSGESTVVVVALDGHGFLGGASAGDSRAWLVGDGDAVDLTEKQARRPLVGSGRAVVTPFYRAKAVGSLLMGTDGLFDYAPRARLLQCARQENLVAAAAEMVDAARLPSGRLQDDVGLVLCRRLRNGARARS